LNTARIYCLEAGRHQGAKRLICDRVDARSLAEGKTITLTVTRTGTFYDPRYGEFEITKDMLLSMVKNFDADVYGQAIMLDVAHKPEDGSAAIFKRVFVDGHKLRAEVKLSAYGIDAIKNKNFIYVSAEFHDDYVDNEKRQSHGPTLLGAGLTTRPVIKHLDPIQLSESTSGDTPTYFSEKVIRLLSEDISKMKHLLEKLKKKLAELKLSAKMIKILCESFEKVGTPMANDDMRRELMESFVLQGAELVKQLAELGSNGEDTVINLSFDAPAGDGGLDAEAVQKLLAEHTDNLAAATKKLSDDVAANVKLFNEAIDGAESLKTLAEDQIKLLKSAADLITADMTADQITKLAETQIAIGSNMATQKQLSSIGFPVSGAVHVSVDDSNGIRSLDETVLKGLRGSSLHSNGRLKLSEKVPAFVDQVLAVFDSMHAPRLLAESKLLAGGTTSTADTSLPVSSQRMVIREALSDLRVLELVQTLTDPGATATTQIPYETRDSSAVKNGGIVYEGNGIHRASIKQEMDLAYILPMKLAMLLSNEVIHFSQSAAIDWNAMARSLESNSRLVRELMVARICNELQRSADSYGAVDVANEAIDAQLNGAKSIVKTAQFPIVRAHQLTDIKGSAIGSVENAITVVLNDVAIGEYDGSGTQAVATYYRVTNYNLGYIQFVDEAGAPVTPANAAGSDNISYSYATNVVKFDLDNGGTDLDLHLNGLLRAISSRQAVMDADRFVRPDFNLMSPILMDTVTNARQFEAQSKRDGSDTTATGDLGIVKGVGSWKTNAPGIDLGDERLVMGQRGTLSYVVAKPFMTGQPFEAVDGNGLPTGEKQAYGEEYSAIKVPVPIRNRLTSIIAYSATARAAV